MQTLVNEIQAALKKSDLSEENFLTHLNEGSTIWEDSFPISIIHSRTRMKEPETVSFFEKNGLLDEKGETPAIYSRTHLKSIKTEIPQAVHCVQFLALKENAPEETLFEAKRTGDFWKKISGVSHIASSFDYATFDGEDDICRVEFILRELIRKRKEVHAFKEVGFIWMAVIDRDVSEVFEHYFQTNWKQLKNDCYIGWSPTLKAINMRYFVCPPR